MAAGFLYLKIMQACFERQFASAVVNLALGNNVFDVPWVKDLRCAEQVYPLRTFDRYAVLGDDLAMMS